MRFWTRELAGWALLFLGLFLFYQVYRLAFGRTPAPVEMGFLTIVGIFIFRGGIHLLKVAVAARVCLEAQDRLYPAEVAAARAARPVTNRSPASRGP